MKKLKINDVLKFVVTESRRHLLKPAAAATTATGPRIRQRNDVSHDVVVAGIDAAVGVAAAAADDDHVLAVAAVAQEHVGRYHYDLGVADF